MLRCSLLGLNHLVLLDLLDAQIDLLVGNLLVVITVALLGVTRSWIISQELAVAHVPFFRKLSLELVITKSQSFFEEDLLACVVSLANVEDIAIAEMIGLLVFKSLHKWRKWDVFFTEALLSDSNGNI